MTISKKSKKNTPKNNKRNQTKKTQNNSKKKSSQSNKKMNQAKICSTCDVIKINSDGNMYSLNNENWKMFPENIPILGRTNGTQTILIDLGKTYSNCLLYYFASKQIHTNKLTEFPKAYQGSNNNGLVKLDINGKAHIFLDCPQPYKEDGNSYISHVHFIVSDKSMKKWTQKLGTQAIVCEISKKDVKRHIKNNDRIIINALPRDMFLQSHIPGSYSLHYKEAQNMSNDKIKSIVKSLIKKHKKIQPYLKNNKITLEDTPLLVYCYNQQCSAGKLLANEFIKAGFTNVIDYKDGILDWMSRN